MYYDIEEEFREPEPDIEEELNKLKDRLFAAHEEYNSSGKTKEDYEKLQYKLLAIAESKNHLLETKVLKKEVEIARLRSDLSFYQEYNRYSSAERLFLCLLCGFAPTFLIPAPDSFFDFIFQIVGAFLFSLLIMLTNILFPKENGRYHLGSFYAEHPNLYSLAVFLIIASAITLYRVFKGGI